MSKCKFGKNGPCLPNGIIKKLSDKILSKKSSDNNSSNSESVKISIASSDINIPESFSNPTDSSNFSNTDTSIKDNNKTIKKIAEKLQCSASNDGSNEICILKKLEKINKNTKFKSVVDATIAKYFQPITKSFDKNYWINNTEIDNIQYQFQTTFDGYYYSNIHMIDLIMFNPQNEKLIENSKKIKPITEINFVNELKKNNANFTYNGELKNFGLVVNTDLSTNGGIHWFSIFIDFTATPITIEYFNSSGYDIRNVKFKKYFINLADEITLKYKKCIFVKVTDIQHQRNDTSNCGGYALYYIYERLKSTPYSHFSDNKITDENIEKFREVLFRLD